jgi:hypothetical protein
MSGFWRVADDLRSRKIQSDAIQAGVDAVAEDATRILAGAIGGDLTLSHYPSRRGPVERARVRVQASGDTGTIRFDPPGLWAIVEQGARPHRIGSASSRRVIPLGRGKFTTSPIRHPGMTPLGHPVSRSTEQLGDVIADSLDRQIDQRIR